MTMTDIALRAYIIFFVFVITCTLGAALITVLTELPKMWRDLRKAWKR